ncbi:MAG: hypothetical protein JWQ72_2974, partial [Polaromonas sp.]|nr:hypothetical protein [Polaromonas sp.]
MSILMQRLLRRYQSPEPGEGGGGNPPPPAPVPPEPETFSKDYVRELRAENKGWRLKATQLETERDTHKTAAEKAAADAEGKITAAQQAANDRIIRAELKTSALKAGMVDLDGLKLADLTKVKLNAAGEVEGADELMVELKKAKPYLLTGASTSSTQEP